PPRKDNLCDEALETSQHLFTDCCVALSFGTSLSLGGARCGDWPKDLPSLFVLVESVNINGTVKACLGVIVQTTMRTIWRYWNRICFDLKPPRKDTLGDDIKKYFKHTLKHKKEELTHVDLGSHLRIKKSLKVQDSDKPKDNNVAGPSVYGKPRHLKKNCKGEKVGNKANGSAFMSTSKLNNSIIWHARLGHVHFRRMQDMSKDGLISAFDMDTKRWFGCRAVVRLPDPKLKTLGERGIEYIFVRYSKHSKAFWLYVIEPNESVLINSIIKSKDAIFDENRFSSVPRPSLKIPNRNKDIGASLKRSLKRDEVSGQHSYCFNVENDTKTFDKAIESQDTTFLNGELDEEVYTNQPQGFIMPGNETKVNLTKEFSSSKFFMKHMGEVDVILVNNLMDTSEKLMPNNGQAMSQLEYYRVIGCLMYDMTCTMPDIVVAMDKLSRYTSNPSTQHWQAIQRASKKQTCIANSTMESEFVALAAAGKEVEWLRNLILDILLLSKPIAPISIRCDSAATLAKAYSQMYNEKSRHLGVRHSMIRELIMNGLLSIEFKFKEDLFTSCIENGILQVSFEPSYDNTNAANALREPFVVNQDPGKNSSQSPPQINHHCCYGCGDSLEGIFFHQCTCELCGNGAHYGYNCPSKVSIIPDLEPFNNQTVEELPPTMPSFDPTCYSKDGNSFTYDSTSNLVHDSPNVFDPPSFFIIAVQTSGSGISNLLAVATTFTGSGNLYCQWEYLTWQWECLVHFIPNRIREERFDHLPAYGNLYAMTARQMMADAIVLLNSYHDVVLALRHCKIVWIRNFYWG
nr:hypothetical protein [Tanacetum cinerariifolium]